MDLNLLERTNNMSYCQAYAAQFRYGEHRPEFVEDKDGLRWERCLDCGEMLPSYSDTQGG